ncbi:MAG: hypothetical protein ACOH19_06140 [Rhodoglobus sp.]
MRVLLKLTLDCPPDAAWLAIRSPHVLGEVSAPLTGIRSLEPGGFPEVWPEGDHRVAVSAFGILPLGEQVIGISFPSPPEGYMDVRMMRDSGSTSGWALSAVTYWQHTLTVAPAPGGKTLYRDRLVFEAGALTPLLWPVYWAFWQWRAIGMRRLARSWPLPR